MIQAKRFFETVGLCLLAAVWLGATGCKSFNSSPGDLTSVTITNRPMAEVQAAVTRVFTAHAFANVRSQENQFTFSRVGTSADQIAYGSLTFHRPITVRVVVNTRQPAPDLIEVGCNAWIIEAENDPVYQEIHSVRYFGRGPYEDLLKEVQTQLGE
jgi:hypothetical protein